MKRNIIHIDEDKCTGCGQCIPNCPEGAIQMIDGKARLVSDLCCDGLGACLGHCPEDAITIEQREAEPYDERRVMENILRQGPHVVRAHLDHLRDHGEDDLLAQARAVLKEKGIPEPAPAAGPGHPPAGGCPGARAMSFSARKTPDPEPGGGDKAEQPSALSQWPVQLKLISPAAGRFQGADVVLAADCVAYALGRFHRDYLAGKALAIACPKLDEGREADRKKLTALIDTAGINTLTVMIMEVPCCGGLLALAQEAAAQATRKIPIKRIVVGIQGDIIEEEWV